MIIFLLLPSVYGALRVPYKFEGFVSQTDDFALYKYMKTTMLYYKKTKTQYIMPLTTSEGFTLRIDLLLTRPKIQSEISYKR